MGPILYVLYTVDVPNILDTIIEFYVDDTGISADNTNDKKAVPTLQTAVNNISCWAK